MQFMLHDCCKTYVHDLQVYLFRYIHKSDCINLKAGLDVLDKPGMATKLQNVFFEYPRIIAAALRATLRKVFFYFGM